jgi:hypothetical protein
MAYKQAQNRKKRLLKTYRETKNCYGGGVWLDEDTGRYRKYTASNTPGYAKSLRKICNKKVRKAKDIGNHSNYKKLYDYWWILF